MFWKLFALGFITDQRTIRMISQCRLENVAIDDVPFDDGRNFLNKITNREGTDSLKVLLEKKESRRMFANVSGCDGRFNETRQHDMIFNITRFIYQMKLLNQLESDDVGVVEKLDAIDQYRKDTTDGGYVANLRAGGLWKDWTRDL